jgi:hypothetical protein
MEKIKRGKNDNRKNVKITDTVHDVMVKYCDDRQMNYRKFLDKLILDKCLENENK